jgi:hypothetical protein
MMASMNPDSAIPLSDAATGQDEVERPHVGWWVSILFGMSLTSTLACSDTAYALWSEHVMSFLSRGTIQKIFVVAWALHIGEALYARKLAGELGFSAAARRGWTLQTFLLGYPSLKKLLQRRAKVR